MTIREFLERLEEEIIYLQPGAIVAFQNRVLSDLKRLRNDPAYQAEIQSRQEFERRKARREAPISELDQSPA